MSNVVPLLNRRDSLCCAHKPEWSLKMLCHSKLNTSRQVACCLVSATACSNASESKESENGVVCTGVRLTGEYVLGCANFSIFKIFLMLSGPVKLSCTTLKYQLLPAALLQRNCQRVPRPPRIFRRLPSNLHKGRHDAD